MSHRRLLAVAFVLFIALGLSAGVGGVAWPEMRATFGRPVSELGFLIAVGTVGYFASGLLAGVLTQRLGIGNLLTLIAGLGTMCLVGYALTESWIVLLLLAVGLGFTGGMIDGVVNAYVALHHDARAMNLVHAFFGLGATVGPVLVAATLARGLSWRIAYVVLAGVEVLLLAVLLRVRRGWPQVAEPEPKADAPGGFGMGVAMLLGLFVLYVGIEVAAGNWAYTVLTESRMMAEFSAGVWVSIYWGALTGGRLILGAIGSRVAPRTVLHLSMLGSIAGSILFWLDPAGLGVAGLTLLGFSLAGVFPILVALTPGWVGEERAPAVIGYQISAAAFGGAALPWLAGELIDVWGLEVVGPFLAVVALAMTALHWVIDRSGNDHSRLAQSRSSRSRVTKSANSSQV